MEHYKSFNEVDSFQESFDGIVENCVAALPTDKGVLLIDNIDFNAFMKIDYRLSNPRLLSSDGTTKVTGSPFSQKEYSNYVFGVVVLKDLQNSTIKNFMNLEDFNKNIKKKVAESVSRSNKNGSSGFMSALVGSVREHENGRDLYVPVLISTSIFYNSHRVTIGAMNSVVDLKDVLLSFKSNFKNNFDDVEYVLNFLSPMETMQVDDVEEEIDSLIEFAEENGVSSSVVENESQTDSWC